MRYNFGLYTAIHHMNGATKVTPYGYADFAVNTFQNHNSQPFSATGSISKRMSSEPRACSVIGNVLDAGTAKLPAKKARVDNGMMR